MNQITPAWQTATLDDIRTYLATSTGHGSMEPGSVVVLDEPMLRRVAELAGADFLVWLQRRENKRQAGK